MCLGQLAALPSFSRAGQTMEPALAGIIHPTKAGDPDARQGHAAEHSRSTQMGFFRGTLRKEISWLVKHSRAISESALGEKKFPFGSGTELPGLRLGFGIPKALLAALLPISLLQAGAGIDPKHPLSQQQKRPPNLHPAGNKPRIQSSPHAPGTLEFSLLNIKPLAGGLGSNSMNTNTAPLSLPP